MQKAIFPYGVRFREDGRVETFPAVEAVVRGRHKKGIHAIFHVDSGATTSVLPMGDAEALNLTVLRGKKVFVRGITGESLHGYYHVTILEFGGLKVRCPVIFVDHDSVPRILGREGVFHLFGILFDEAKHRTVFIPRAKAKNRIEVLFS